MDYMDKDRTLWRRCVDFHGHQCGGLTIGYKAALYAMELLELTFSQDEQVVCIAENDACGVDAGAAGLLRGEGKPAVPHTGEAGILHL